MTELVRQTAEQLLEAVGQFRRRMRRISGGPEGLAGHTRAEAELMRCVRRNPGLTVTEAAETLGIAVNTTSTLVTMLSSAGRLTRTADTSDRRVVRLTLTPEARGAIDRWRDARAEATMRALEGLSTAELEALVQALPVLERITTLVGDGS